MTAMADLTSLSLPDALAHWLVNPVIKVSSSDEVDVLREQLSTLQREYDSLQLEYDRVSSNYRDLTIRCLDLQDLLRVNGIKVR